MRVFSFPRFLAALALAAVIAAGQTTDPDEVFAQALKLHQSGDLKGAIAAYERFLQMHPDVVEAISNVGAAYARLGDYAKAIPNYRRALELAPDNTGVRFNLGLALSETGRTAEAMEEFTKVLATDQSNRRTTLLLADCYFRQAKYRNVVALLDPLEKAEPGNRAVLYLLGTALIREGQGPRGMALMDRLLRDGDSPEAHLMLGLGRMMNLDHPGALKEFRRALELNPKIATAHSLSGQCLLVLNRTDEAIAEFRRELENDPNDFESHLQLGSLLRKDGKLEPALEHLERAAAIRPGSPDVRYQIASAHLAQGKTAEAEAALEQLVKEYPRFNEAHISLATIYYRTGRKADGDRERETVRKLEAELKEPIVGAGREASPAAPKQAAAEPAAPSAPAGEFEQLASEAAAARDGNRTAEAIGLYQKGLQRKPEWVEGWWYVGTLYYEDDRYQEARDAFAHVVNLKPGGGVGWAMLGLCEFQLKQYNAALVHLQRGRQFGLAENHQLTRVTRYHVAILLTRFNEPESATRILNFMALDDERHHRERSPAVVIALGLAGLQMPLLPLEVPDKDRELVNKVGEAEYYNALLDPAKAGPLLEDVAARYGDRPGVHYCYGVYLYSQNPEKALAEFKTELKLSPKHVKARLQLALAHIRRGEFARALPYAEETLKLAPQMFISHRVMGEALLGLDRIEPAIKELEAAVKLAPDSPESRYSLARAYAAAGRREDAARERAEFARLDRARRQLEQPHPAEEKEGASAATQVNADHQTTTGQRP